ncbi:MULTISPECIES: UDP-N-acetylglucosamine 1-carboxyvinyltransferase [unclassified Prochlorococcus]|uniref:UDP-N-acetylglucosamine 1-carboxyvinyltransferase n=1 Tax=unclassified Prochlorococcus TaxID=2627481 RepID=UPI000533BA1D|nr:MULTISPECIES: UDP-N-acetylglucosamine 1-carboxyvinyltransferase [unclassified Prochlorococcus]KGG16268.1 UDP-N-acetylglucosamine 1-carboxyvinyltransferase [Prochlorococcus sp. MIT 0603]KGG17998.1 UDP-N-acetylglucosamine 1-carboxyvinyltransferase [Prochlorococcus sp. MIT 0602]
MHNVARLKSEDSLLTHFKVKGGQALSGHIEASGAKNSSLVLMAASLLTEEVLTLSNVPRLTDIQVMSDLLYSMGVRLVRKDSYMEISSSGVKNLKNNLPYELVNGLRASFFCIGPLLAKLGEVKMPLPGGCRIGSRPIDEHIEGLRALGADVKIENNHVLATTINPQKRLIGAKIKFNCKSVGATETILMAATLAKGITILENAAQEPEIQDLAKMLNKMGAKIEGAGTDTVIIEGVETLRGCSHSVIPDRIEIGTFMIAAAISRCSLTISPVIPEHLASVILKLQECGCLIEQSGQTLKIIPGKNIKAVDIVTMPFPGFPTDLQAPFMALMTTANGTSRIQETVFESRMQHVEEFQKMGAQIMQQDNTAFVKGPKELTSNSVRGGDLRSCAAMVLASLVAKGTSSIQGLDYLDRGYEKFEEKLRSIGAIVSRITVFDGQESFKGNTKKSDDKQNYYSGTEVA